MASTPVASPCVTHLPAPVEDKPNTPALSAADENESTADDTESLDSNSSSKKDASPRTQRSSSRGVTMQMLLQEGVLEAGTGVLSIDYLGQKFFGDLLQNGKILWEGNQFASPSSWATFIKKSLNPTKKSGCGWNSVKYKGKKLDKLKSNWFRKNNPVNTTGPSPAVRMEEESNPALSISQRNLKVAVKAADIKSRINADPTMSIEYEYFDENTNMAQPFSVIVSTSALLLIDFHCHMSMNEVVGYLGGKWDPIEKCLYIMQALPCCCNGCDQEAAAITEQEVNNILMRQRLMRVGWYHSHPYVLPEPTVQDIDVQYEMQVTSKIHPALGIICTPYDTHAVSNAESNFNFYWVMPFDTGHKQQLPGTPMKLKYDEVAEASTLQDIYAEIKRIVEYYKLQGNTVSFRSNWKGNVTYLDKLKLSMQKRLGKDKAGVQLVQFVHGLLSNTLPVIST